MGRWSVDLLLDLSKNSMISTLEDYVQRVGRMDRGPVSPQSPDVVDFGERHRCVI